jgi:hypothetical protein
MNTQEKIKVKKILFWYSFLRLSVAYRDAQLVDGGRVKKEEAAAKHKDFEKVLYWYSKVGRVWLKNPIDIFFANSNLFAGIFDLRGGVKVLSRLEAKNSPKTEQIVQKLTNYVKSEWALGGMREQFIISVPTKIDKKKIIEQIESALKDYDDDLDHYEAESKRDEPESHLIALAGTKIRLEVLERCYNLILLRALNPNISALEQARMLGVSKDKVALLDEAIALKDKVGKTAVEYDKVANIPEYQINIKAVVWKYTQRAYLLADNAARGEFPSFKVLDEHKTTPEFVYEHIAEMAGQIRDRMNLDGIVHSFTDEFCSEAQLERCYSIFPKYFEVMEAKPKVDVVLEVEGKEEIPDSATFAMVKDLRRMGKTQRQIKSAERRKFRIDKAMKQEALQQAALK